MFSRTTRSTRLRETRMPFDRPRSRAQILAVSLALPGGCLQAASKCFSLAEPRPRSSRLPVPGALLVGAQRWPELPGFHGVERGTGKTPGRTDPLEAVGQTRAGRGGGTHRRDLRRPKGPDVIRLGLQQFHLHDQLPDPLHGDVQFRHSTEIALAFLERGIDPGESCLHRRHCSSRKISTPNCRDTQFHRHRHRNKPQGNLTLGASPSTAGQVPAMACSAKPMARGKRGRARSSPSVYHRPIEQSALCSQNCRSCSGPPWTTSIKPRSDVQGNRVRLNPLQHIPVVSWAYRAITGDQIAPGPMAIGGGLFGGLAGFSLGTAEAMIKGSSGKDGGGHLFAFLREAASPGDAPGGPVVADAPPQHGGPEIPPDQTPVLTPEQMAVLLASLPAPATNQNLAAPYWPAGDNQSWRGRRVGWAARHRQPEPDVLAFGSHGRGFAGNRLQQKER